MKTAAEKLENYEKFCKASMEWCVEQSEQSSGSIMEVLTSLTQDSKRISKMSQTTIGALNEVKNNFTSATNLRVGDTVKKLTSALHNLRKDHAEIDEVINPIIEALQFQDRTTQNMENLVKMIRCWRSLRQSTKGQHIISEKEFIAFGEELLTNTTMKEESDIIRSVIPNLSEEKEHQESSAVLF